MEEVAKELKFKEGDTVFFFVNMAETGRSIVCKPRLKKSKVVKASAEYGFYGRKMKYYYVEDYEETIDEPNVYASRKEAMDYITGK